ncbi:MAG: hypothetical protein U1F43_03720 [Myxococcota bacterium]
MDIINRINSTRYLGREFLTWLWYRSSTQEGVFQLTEGPIELWFDATLTLEAQGEVKEQNVIKAENPTETPEAHAAILTGKVVSSARLRVVNGQKQWVFGMKGETLGLSSVKIPALLSREDDDQLYERFMLIEEIEDTVNALYQQFIELRMDDDQWRPEIQAIRSWVHRVEA